ncbi:hypothetical protein [Paraburkholderia dinghuensis]|uniref:Uncharacterized protein n=1 Tax=Paraburkholderia dinghuensis TaxID=2305225 RepID=A0A3N6NCP2_9BURK|nr:hypothetical protein [Paraburkholderia dinghuensis]RQH09091.1 hypothetical protein D1Y85_04305 [Paraburkholderia dinghuensis]
MQLQPVVMNAFHHDLAPDSGQIQSPTNTYGNTGNSPFIWILERAEEISKAQDQRIDDDLKAHAKSQSSTAKLLNLLQLQYDLDDMQFSATLAKNVANQFSQALTTLTQRN